MPEHENDQPKPKSTGALGGFVQAESAIQLALAIPAGAFAGLLLGGLLDRHFHKPWMVLAGIFLGAAGGFIQVFTAASRMIKRGDQ